MGPLGALKMEFINIFYFCPIKGSCALRNTGEHVEGTCRGWTQDVLYAGGNFYENVSSVQPLVGGEAGHSMGVGGASEDFLKNVTLDS